MELQAGPSVDDHERGRRRIRHAAEALVVAVATLFVLGNLYPDLLVSPAIPAGGDMGAHVWGPAYLRDHLLPELRLSGWTPDWYAGFPAYQFYMVVPSLLIVALDVGVAAGWTALGPLGLAAVAAFGAFRARSPWVTGALVALAAGAAVLGPELPYGTAFKLVTVAGVVSLPAAAWAFGRLAGLPFPAPPLLAVAAVPFLFDRNFTIYGGNIASTLAGEFAFSISLSIGLLYLGVVVRGLRTGRHRALAAVLLALTGLCHLIPAFFVLVGTALIALSRPARSTVRWLVAVLPVGGLISAFWVLPFWWQRAFVNDMGWEKVPYAGETVWKYLVPRSPDSPTDLRWVIALAVVGVVLSLVFRLRAGVLLAAFAVAAGVAFALLPEGRLWNARVLPFYYLSLYLLAAVGVALAGRSLSALAARDPDRPGLVGPLATAVVATVGALVVVALPLRTLPLGDERADGSYEWLGFVNGAGDASFVRSWAHWNYSGYEGKEAYAEYRDLVLTMDRIGQERGCGRSFWEYEKELNRYGTPMALMLLPHFTDGCIGSMEGLFFEASATTPFHFLTQVELSSAPSAAQRDMPYDGFDLTAGVQHLQLMGVRYYLATSEQAVTAADAHPDLTPLDTSGPWTIYEVAGSALVEPLGNEPVVLEDASHVQHDWICSRRDERDRCYGPAVAWFEQPDGWDVPLAVSGPDEWARVDEDELRAGVRPTPVEPVEVDAVEVDHDRIAFEVDRPGTPVLVKASYFPNWDAKGADGPYRVAPNLMVVVPTDTEVTLTYGRQPVEWLAWLLTLAGLVLVVLVARRPAVTVTPVPRLARFGLVTAVATATDVAVLLVLREALGWPLVIADAVAIALAAVIGYVLHRTVSLRSDPYVRWVRLPVVFAAVALTAGLLDVAVLRAAFALTGFDTPAGLLVAKAVALAVAAAARVAMYRAVLLVRVRRALTERVARPAPPGELRATVVIPAYDEAERIGATVAAFRTWADEVAEGGPVEVVVVDDGSGDGTADAALAAGADQVLTMPVNRGKGAAVRAGVHAARGRVVVFTDADLAYGPEQVAAAVAAVEAGWDVAVGNRRHRAVGVAAVQGGLRSVGSRLINAAASIVLLSRPHDTQCGLKAFRSDVARALFGLGRIDGFAFDIELLHLVERHELSLVDVPARPRAVAGSTVRVWRDGVRLLRDLWAIRRYAAEGAYELPDGLLAPIGEPEPAH